MFTGLDILLFLYLCLNTVAFFDVFIDAFFALLLTF